MSVVCMICSVCRFLIIEGVSTGCVTEDLDLNFLK
jgi:hypothetical protein